MNPSGMISLKKGNAMRKLNKEAVDLQVESSYVEDGTLYVLVSQPSLFAEMDRPKKLDLFERDLLRKLRAHEIKTNYEIYEFALRSGFLSVHARDALKSMMDKGDIPKQKIPLSRECMKVAPVHVKLQSKERP